ncbi:MAG: YkgJ family cysteine cluster protein [Pseudopedobacter sp.]|nr:YkgJ family cysteine cluster protein [Deinococcales bacterium]
MSNPRPDPFTAPLEYAPRSAWNRECTACGACCSAPDITALEKPLGVPCVHLDAGCLCQIYLQRPQVCRNYDPDWVCGEVAPLPTLEGRIGKFLEIYGLLEELRH